MKNLIILFVLMLSLKSFGQLEKPITKGNKMLMGEGSISYSKSTTEIGNLSINNNTFRISLSPGLAYFIIDNLAIGANTIITYNGIKDNKSYQLGLGPMIRYYFKNGPFLSTEFGYSVTRGLESNSNTYKHFYLKPGVGYSFFLNNKVSLDPSLSYEFEKADSRTIGNHYTINVNNLLLEISLSIFM